LVLFFPAPQTVTGEDVLELHIHGGPAIVRAVLEAIPSCQPTSTQNPFISRSAIRYAEPGEFTKRAFYNGRLDLTQAEALGDTLAADTEQQRRLAVNGAGGILAARYEEWRNMLLYARGELEALIDFSEDQHFDESPHELVASITKQVLALKRQVELHMQNASKGELLRNGISVALLGAPNAGKSSLLNRIVGREAAIVSQEEGTTRDIVDVSVDIGGWLVRLGDMAGLRNKLGKDPGFWPQAAIGAVEQEGMRRARARALESDVVVVVVSLEEGGGGGGKGGESPLTIRPHFESEVVDAVRECEEAGKTIVVAVSKIDKVPTGDIQLRNSIVKELQATFPYVQKDYIFTISCRPPSETLISPHHTPDPDPGNIQSFLNGLTKVFSTLTTPSGEPLPVLDSNPTSSSSYWSHSLSVTHRQRTYLAQTLLHLDDYLLQTSSSGTSTHHIDGHDDLVGDIDTDIVAAAEHLRFAAECLAKITGKGESGDVEDVLGVVFEK
jgi:tRNA modification GTPase